MQYGTRIFPVADELQAPEVTGLEGQGRGIRRIRPAKPKIRKRRQWWTEVLTDGARALAATCALAFAGWVAEIPRAMAFQGEGGSVVTEGGIFEFALRQGGALFVLLVVLWFYRRDYKALADFWKQSDGQKTRLIEDLTRAQTETAEAMRETAQALRENTRVIDVATSVMERGERGRIR